MRSNIHKTFNKQSTIEFIEDYHRAELLWNRYHSDYNNLDARRDTIRLLAIKYKITELDIKKKIKSIRSYYVKEDDKVNGRGQESTWFAYKMLSFLKGMSSTSANGSAKTHGNAMVRSDSVLRRKKRKQSLTTIKTEPSDQQHSSAYDDDETNGREIKWKLKRLQPSSSSSLTHSNGEAASSMSSSQPSSSHCRPSPMFHHNPYNARTCSESPLPPPPLPPPTQSPFSECSPPPHHQQPPPPPLQGLFPPSFLLQQQLGLSSAMLPDGSMGDEYELFGQLIGCKIRNMASDKLRYIAQHRIVNILFELEMMNE